MASNTNQTTTITTVSGVSTETMKNYGASWFDNLSTMALEYPRYKLAKSQPQTPMETPLASPTEGVTRAYGGSYFGNMTAQQEEQKQQAAAEKPMHNYGVSWFDKYDTMWEEWQQSKLAKDARK